MQRAEEKTVLVVDDEPEVRTYLASILKDARFNVLTAADGEEALEIAHRVRPDFISLDLVMPKKNGHKVLYELRKDKDLARIPVLIVTAHAQDDLGQRQMDDLFTDRVISGPGVYLEKPVKPADYVRCVQRALGLEESPAAADQADLKDEVEGANRKCKPECPAAGARRAERKGIPRGTVGMPMSQETKTILILDDEPGVVEYLEMLLSDNGYQTITAANAQDGLTRIKAQRPDLITLDISMPEKSGVRFYKELKEDPDLASIPVVIVTGVTGFGGDPYGYMKFMMQETKLPEPDAFFPKPVDREELLQKISSLLARPLNAAG